MRQPIEQCALVRGALAIRALPHIGRSDTQERHVAQCNSAAFGALNAAVRSCDGKPLRSGIGAESEESVEESGELVDDALLGRAVAIGRGEAGHRR